MKLSDALMSTFPKKDHLFLSVTGGGGKTSLLRLLGHSYRAMGKKVLLTTTTKFQSPKAFDWDVDKVFTNAHDVLSFFPSSPVVVVYGEEFEDEKRLRSPDEETLLSLLERYDVVVAEADGSRHLPLKKHTQRDPVVPSWSDWTIALVGAWGVGKEKSLVVFGDNSPGTVDGEYLQSYIDSPEGLLKGALPGSSTVLLNGWDQVSPETSMLFSVAQWPEGYGIIRASVEQNETYD